MAEWGCGAAFVYRVPPVAPAAHGMAPKIVYTASLVPWRCSAVAARRCGRPRSGEGVRDAVR